MKIDDPIPPQQQLYKVVATHPDGATRTFILPAQGAILAKQGELKDRCPECGYKLVRGVTHDVIAYTCEHCGMK